MSREIMAQNKIVINNSQSTGTVKLTELIGNTHKSKNLLKHSATTKSINGLTFTVQNDKSIKVSGTASATTQFELVKPSVSVESYPNGAKLVGCPSGGSATTYEITAYSSGGSGTTFRDRGDGVALTESISNAVVIIIVRANVTCNNLVFKPMITTDTSLTYADYEPYGITNAGQQIDGSWYEVIKEHNKNLLMPTLNTSTVNGITCTNNGDGTYKLSGTASGGAAIFYVGGGWRNESILPNGNYRLVGCPSGGENNKTYLLDCYSGNTTTYTRYIDVGNGAIINSNVFTVRIIVFNGYTCNNVIFKPMLVDATLYPSATYDDFVQGKADTANIPLTSPLCGINGVQDYIDASGEHHLIGSVDLGSYTWSGSDGTYNIQLSGIKQVADNETVANIICEPYQTVTRDYLRTSDKCISLQANSNYIVAKDTSIASATAFKTAMNGVILYYELSTPTTTPLTSAQVEAMNSLVVYDGSTYIESADADSVNVGLTVLYDAIHTKTNWKSTDFFNVADYNRIKNNIQYLSDFASSLFYTFSPITATTDKAIGDIPYASEINKFANDLEQINNSTYHLDIGTKVVYHANGSTPLYSDYNRMENAILNLYTTMTAQKNALAKLPFRLGNQKGLRV